MKDNMQESTFSTTQGSSVQETGSTCKRGSTSRASTPVLVVQRKCICSSFQRQFRSFYLYSLWVFHLNPSTFSHLADLVSDWAPKVKMHAYSWLGQAIYFSQQPPPNRSQIVLLRNINHLPKGHIQCYWETSLTCTSRQRGSQRKHCIHACFALWPYTYH